MYSTPVVVYSLVRLSRGCFGFCFVGFLFFFQILFEILFFLFFVLILPDESWIRQADHRDTPVSLTITP